MLLNFSPSLTHANSAASPRLRLLYFHCACIEHAEGSMSDSFVLPKRAPLKENSQKDLDFPVLLQVQPAWRALRLIGPGLPRSRGRRRAAAAEA